jgi:hypothetical protein
MKKDLQCKHIPERPILEFLSSMNGRWSNWFAKEDGSPYENSVLHAMPPGLPGKLVLAKMDSLIRRGLVDGCSCGCRGDFVITEKGDEYRQRLNMFVQ